ncbi:MAG: hypothetical protein SFV19_02160 [Rhodospirillaceae bacterium]|nr:hypothetical protein [Rhodospirillaceae bacterium]
MTKSLISPVIVSFVLASVLSLAVFAPAARADETRPTPIWAEQSILVGQSTAALVTGHTRRAIRLASSAVDRVTGHDRIVALHNLCLAWLKHGEQNTASGYCDAAVRDIAENPQLDRVVRANISAAQRTLLAQAAETARN